MQTWRGLHHLQEEGIMDFTTYRWMDGWIFCLYREHFLITCCAKKQLTTSGFLYLPKNWCKWLVGQTYLWWMISSHSVPEREFKSQGRSCSRFFGKETFIYPLFIWVKTVINIKNVFFKRALAESAAERSTNTTSRFYEDILNGHRGLNWL